MTSDQNVVANETVEVRTQIIIAAFVDDSTKDIDGVDSGLLADKNAYDQIRRSIVKPLIDSADYTRAAKLLEKMVNSEHSNLVDHLLLVRTCLKGAMPIAGEAVAKLGLAYPFEAKSVAARIQYHLQRREVGAAALIGKDYRDWSELEPRAVNLALLAFVRNGDKKDALDLIDVYKGDISKDMGAVIMRVFVGESLAEKAITLSKQLISEGKESAEMHAQAAYALLMLCRNLEADVHLGKSLSLRPENVRALSVRGELRLAAGDNDQAIADLEKALELAPDLAHIRLNYARALKAARRYPDAAREFLTVCNADPESETLRRFASAALNQAGDTKAATRFYDGLLVKREQALPSNFEDGLAELWDRIDQVNVPQARLDWAWKLRHSGDDIDRAEWEQRARWGNLADHYIYDWLECRTDEAEKVMMRLSDLDAPTNMLREIMGEARGMIIASAHIGMMYAGPLALELGGFRSKWLASTPAIPTIGFYEQLISTSDQTEAQVVRKALAAIEQGYAVTIAIDGAMHAAAPRVAFEGQNVTYSSFAARLAYRKRTRSVFGTPQWRDGKIKFYLRELPFPNEGESIEKFSERWRVGYFEHLRLALGKEPENLRLTGGIWRNITAEL